MKTSLVTLLLILAFITGCGEPVVNFQPTPQQTGWAILQHREATIRGEAGTIALSHQVTAGSLIVVCISELNEDSAPPVITDNRGNQYTLAVSDLSQRYNRVYYAQNAASGTTVLTIDTTSTGDTFEVFVTEISGAAKNPPYRYGIVEHQGGNVVDGVSVANVAKITSVFLNNAGVLTVDCDNTFSVGQQITFNGLVNATFLNDQTVTLIGAIPTGIEALVPPRKYGSVPDTGTATNLDPTGQTFNGGGITTTSQGDLLFDFGMSGSPNKNTATPIATSVYSNQFFMSTQWQVAGAPDRYVLRWNQTDPTQRTAGMMVAFRVSSHRQ